MKNKKATGFTLIELLAIIVILAIIAVITVPIILNVIDTSKVGAIKDSAYGYKDAVSKYYVTKLYENQNLKLDGEYTVTDGKMTGNGIDNVEIPVSGNVPASGTLVYKNNVLESGYLIIDGYKVEIENGEITSTSKDNASSDSDGETDEDITGNVIKDSKLLLEISDGSVEMTATLTPVPSETTNLTYHYYYRKYNVGDYVLAYSGQENTYTYDVAFMNEYDFKVIVTDENGNSVEAEKLKHFYCFVAGTKVYTENGYMNIEEIQIGDKVYALDLETNEQVLKEVTDTIVSRTFELYHLTIDDETVSATPKHQFYIVDKGWVRASDIEIGDQVITKDGIKEISEINYELLEESIEVYNLTVDGLHNYLVTEYSILVHNAGSK